MYEFATAFDDSKRPVVVVAVVDDGAEPDHKRLMSPSFLVINSTLELRLRLHTANNLTKYPLVKHFTD